MLPICSFGHLIYSLYYEIAEQRSVMINGAIK